MNFFKDPRRRPFLITVAVVVVLWLIIFPWIKSVQNRVVRDTERVAAVRTIEAALEQYAGRAAALPTSDEAKLGFVCATGPGTVSQMLIEQKFLSIAPVFPAKECVKYRSDGKDYKLKTKLEDARLNTQDQGMAEDSADWFEVSTAGARDW